MSYDQPTLRLGHSRYRAGDSRAVRTGPSWERQGKQLRHDASLKPAVSPEVLFIERYVQWLKPGGRMGIVLPDGILGNPGDEYIRHWILRHCWVLASIDLPVESFIVEANVNILTSLLFLKKKTQQRNSGGRSGQEARIIRSSWPLPRRSASIAAAISLYKRKPDGEEILEEKTYEEKVRIGGKLEVRILHRKERIPDDDLPKIADAYAEFRAKHPEPGK